MPDNLSPNDRIRTMRSIRGKYTGPERTVRAMLAGRGISGWKANYGDLLGNPDIVFLGKRVAIFIDGCFWHDCPVCAKPLPETNRDYWDTKIGRNAERDRTYTRRLKRDGWKVVRIWEHEIVDSLGLSSIADRIESAIMQAN